MPLRDGSYKGANWASRRALLDLLKLNGELTSAQMADALGVSAMAIRQHMQELETAGDVRAEDRVLGKGRPSKIWSLTESGQRHFPDRHKDLIVDVLGGVAATLGEEAVDRVLDERASEQVASYERELNGCEDLISRVKRLAELRSAEGYMAEVEVSEGDPALTLVENHCPICAAAKICRGLCARELEVFSRVLGPKCKVTREEHLLSGERRCAYRIQPEA